MTYNPFIWPNYFGGKNGQHRQSTQAPHGDTPQASGAPDSRTIDSSSWTGRVAQGPVNTANNPSASQGAGVNFQYNPNSMQMQQVPAGGIMPIPTSQWPAMVAAMQAHIAAQASGQMRHLGYQSYTPVLSGRSLSPYTPTPLKVESAGISLGEIIGHRCWIAHSVRRILSSVFMHYEWKPGAEERANVKMLDTHEGGFYAFKDQYQAINEYGKNAGNTVIFGTVYLWGQVLEYERGYRAEYAKIRSLDLAVPNYYAVSTPWHELRDEADKELMRLRELYGVEGEDKA